MRPGQQRKNFTCSPPVEGSLHAWARHHQWHRDASRGGNAAKMARCQGYATPGETKKGWTTGRLYQGGRCEEKEEGWSQEPRKSRAILRFLVYVRHCRKQYLTTTNVRKQAKRQLSRPVDGEGLYGPVHGKRSLHRFESHELTLVLVFSPAFCTRAALFTNYDTPERLLGSYSPLHYGVWRGTISLL